MQVHEICNQPHAQKVVCLPLINIGYFSVAVNNEQRHTT